LEEDWKYCNILPNTATHCNTFDILEQGGGVVDTLQHTATHCNTFVILEQVGGEFNNGILAQILLILIFVTCVFAFVC